MSLILDALNRADQERTTDNNSPNLQTSHSPIPVATSPVRRWIIEAVIIVIALAAFGYSQWSDKAIPATQIIGPSTTIDIKPATLPAVMDNTIVSAQQPEPASASIQSTNKTVAKPEDTNPAITISKQPQTDDSAIASLYQQPVSSSNITVPATPTKKAIAKPVVNDNVDVTENILSQIPLLTDHSAQFQRSVPSIDYAIHVYSENDKAGFVKINGAIRKIGAEIAPGLTVVAILKDSLVLDYNGTQFRLAALNSWMNFN